MMGKRWTQEEEKFIKINWQEMSDKDLADKLGRTKSAITNKRQKLDIKRVQQKPFTDKELEFLENNYKDMTHKELAKNLDRNKQTITDQLNRMDLIKTPFYSKEEEEFIETNWQKLSDHELADELNRSVVSVRKKRRSIGCKRDTFVNTEKHWDWEKVCEKAAKEIHNNVETQKVMQGLRPDIFVPEENLVIDAKTSCYRGLNDLKKYKNLDQVDKVVVWSMRPVKNANNRFEVLDINDIDKKVSFDINEELENECEIKQTSIQEVITT